MEIIPKYKIYLQVFFVMVICLSLTTVLFVEILWWNKNNPKKENQVITGFQTNFGKVITVGQVLGRQQESVKVDESVVGHDARPLIIERYLKKYNSPLLSYSRLIFDLSQTYGFDYYWIVAIAQQESNLCKKIPENSFNCWGYGIHKKGTLRFENYELALKSYALYLKTQYFDKGLNTPELIMKKYCPSSNGSWAYGVQQFIDEMESGNF
ncbi:hypothetical protein CO009_03425 [Candidatus Shapirobacteria bacterium CG_4_8_14_3_um_filter_35_11]|uniref:Mannosyl-glycoprotein endo-beta-N-acetylglucosamidase-like domain-containing protein n=5 Tax=Candidatus Shapironibacteriota TaxID=1752721 RepID=A0A1J5I8Y6_9BACT|nr:MAG: hypothetical protein AUK05_00665 [Candidatus Shapirobacteria bacterium CG2_30_35_20]PIV07836.1 MAG: hypothetical protein COS53_00290 [Candidatus Shapirobacteria bacterium CG03_land_8_20_14_0_80_35_14]PIX68270.1 MAG: hypothetical protein COZ41_00580 [Candidatus Shapirobacteria bacterium CG_4_10_14_3_um_filter_35_13]PJA51256.1 MAG: hypothetical protein CO168_00715 [Candidatus Shapirobacteria bacterium CG_4_9_14_3_um_filter_36_12]PJC79777.1 MAG: hypothetical protein CO009_03425 [Candidatus